MFTVLLASLSPRARATFILLIAIGLSGCHEKKQWPIPKTYPVTGKVVVSEGQIPVGARIEFETSDPEVLAEGTIAADGSFTLRTLFHEEMLPGATEGPHRVLIRPSGAHTLVLEDRYTVEPKVNHFIVKLDSQPIPRGEAPRPGSEPISP